MCIFGQTSFKHLNKYLMGKEKPTELTYTNLKDMDKSTFAKLFKKPAIWKKAKAVVFLAK